MLFSPSIFVRVPSLRLLPVALLLAATLGGVRGGAADEPVRTVDPRPYGIDLPAGNVLPGERATVSTADNDGKPTIGRVHVRVGEGAVVMLPDGQLVARAAGRFAESDRPFEPLGKEAMLARLAEEFPGFKLKAAAATPYIYVYNTSEPFATATSRILESMLSDNRGVKAFAENQRLSVHAPEVPLVVLMFRTEDEFQKHQRMPPGVVAYYHTLSNRVVMYEESRLARGRPDLAIGQSLSTIAHEGVHQILHNIGVQQRLSVWPMWLAEGLAEYLAPTSTGKNLMWKGAGQVNDLRMFELEQYIKSRASETFDGAMIEQTVMAARLSSTGYAAAWSLVHHLAKTKRVEFAAYLREVAQIGPLSGAPDSGAPFVRSNMTLFEEHFGSDLVDQERRLVLHLKKLPYSDPFAGAPHVVAMLTSGDARRPQRTASTFHSPALAEKWLGEMLDKLDENQRSRAQSTLRVFPNRAQAEAFARQWQGGR
ncbi:MAG: DUF1570 domain-containing protein [Pirellulaceae bacterium]|jgi:hypothetical protein|nr:DUF1570 domain-containing protein [Pirellulaceae bacterium]